MNSFIADYWGVIVAALFIILALFWLLRGRGGTLPEDSDVDLSGDLDADAAVGAASIAASKGVSPPDVKQPEPSETEVALERSAATSAPTAKVSAAPSVADPDNIAVERPGIPPAVGEPDNLKLLKGVGPKLSNRLAELGVTRFDQIAAWTASDIAEVDKHLGTFKGRIERDNWTEQAGFLARGDRAGFEAKYGALGGELPQR